MNPIFFTRDSILTQKDLQMSTALTSPSPSMDPPWTGYESLGKTNQQLTSEYNTDFNQRSASRRGYHVYNNMVAATTFISRSVRARRRRAFLKTYTLSSLDDGSASQSKRHQVKRAATKIKSVVASAIETARSSSRKLGGCTSRSVICPASPIASY